MKHYTDQDFVRLIEAVEADGGKYLAETCVSEEYDFVMQDARVTRMIGNDCEEDALFLVAYDPSATVEVPTPILVPDTRSGAPKGRKMRKKNDAGQEEWTLETAVGDSTQEATLELVKVCANDDLMRLWPRFQRQMKDNDPVFGSR